MVEIQKISKEEIERLNQEGALYSSKENRDQGKSTNANTVFFGDNGELYLDDEGRIIEQHEDGSKSYMAWTDVDKYQNYNNKPQERPSNADPQPFVKNGDDINIYPVEDPTKKEERIVSITIPEEEEKRNTAQNNVIKEIKLDKNGNVINEKQEAKVIKEIYLDENGKPIPDEYDNVPGDSIQTNEQVAMETKSAIDVNTDPRFKKEVPEYYSQIGIKSSIFDENTKKTRTETSHKTISAINVNSDSRFTNNGNNENINENIPTENEKEPTQDIIKPIATSNMQNDKYYAFSKDILGNINEKRREQGLPDLEWSDELSNVASIRAEEISKKLSHKRPNGEDWFTALDRDNTKWYAENLAYNYPDPSSFVEGWMNSPSHRDNLLFNEFRTVGISVYEAEDGQTFCAAEFSS